MFIVGNIFGCLFWGALIAIAVTIAVWLLCLVLDRVASLLTYIVLVVLLLLTGVQATLMVGALYSKGYVTDIGDYANSLFLRDKGDTMSNMDIDNLCVRIVNEFPVAKPLLDKMDTSGLQAYVAKGHTVIEYVTDDLKSTLNWYILRRVLWILGFVGGAVVAILILNRPHDYTYDIDSIDTIC